MLRAAVSPSNVPPALVGELKARLVEGRAELARALPAAPGDPLERAGFLLGRRHARLLDEIVGSLFKALQLAVAFPPGASPVAVAGVGGYGRGAVALGSDLDLPLLARDVASATPIADSLLYPLWDLGVAVGHQVVTIDDLLDAARTDLPTATSLLDWRHVAGDAAASEALQKRAASGIFAHSELPGFMRRLSDEVAQRHERFGGSVYLLEPDVKNGPGGLRDLDIAAWAARARWGVSTLDELVRIGVLVAREANEIQGAAEMLWRIRNLLHAHAGRRRERLPSPPPEAIARRRGFGAGGPEPAAADDEPPHDPEAVERMMSEYYRAARTITRAREMILTRATPLLSRKRPHDEDLGGGVHLFDGAVTIGSVEALWADPALALRVVAAAVERGLPLLAFARDAIARAAGDPMWGEHLRASSEAARRFVELCTSCRETALHSGTIARELHDLGLLLAMVPEFSPVVGRVHHDVYHVYTVDVHSVAALDRLALLSRGELASEFPLACRLAAEVSRRAMLFFATLLHDVGKAIGGKDHSQRGAEMARGILTRLGLGPEDVDEACHLIQKHLVMYHVATRRDLDDPAAIAEFLPEVHGREGLRDLYLLTVVDLSTTSPTSMTSWKARMLDELYLAADVALGGAPAEDGRVAAAIAEVERAAAALPAASAADRAARAEFLGGYLRSMPERYVLANSPPAIAAHAELARRHEARGADAGAVSVALVPSRHPEAAELCVVASDRPGLLAAITAAIAGSRLEVHAAQIHSRALPGGSVEAVDLFWVRDRGEGVEGVARALPKLVRDLSGLVSGETSPADLARRRASASPAARSGPKVRTEVSLDDRASPRHTVIEVTTRDRPGLLFAISEALHRLGLTIAVAKINTEGTRVADVFYVSEADGTKVAPGPRTAFVRDRILEALDEPPASSG